MPVARQQPDPAKFNHDARLPYQLRIDDFRAAMQDVYDFFRDINTYLLDKGLLRLDDTLRAANMSGLLSDMLTASMAKHSRTLVVNGYFNGHPDLIVQGQYPNNAVKAGESGVEVKSTRKKGGAVDTHGGRDQWLCVFVYSVDNDPAKAAADRRPMTFSEVYIGQVGVTDFRRNERGELGTRTSTLHADGIAKLRTNWVYLDQPASTRRTASRGSAERASSK